MRMALFIVKLIVALAVLVAAVYATNFSTKRFDAMKEATSVESLKAELAAASTSEEETGELIFAEARDLLATSELAAARPKLVQIVNFYPQTRSAAEARRILGEMNLDRLLALSEPSNKQVHKVVRGDNYLNIAETYESTLDMIMFLNGLDSLSGLQPDDELVVMPLNFRLIIKPDAETVELWSGDEYVKEYLVEKMGSDLLWRRSKSKISGKAGYLDGRRVLPRRLDDYRASIKALSLDGLPIELRSVDELAEDGDVTNMQALYFKNADMEELAMLLRVNNEVVIRRAGS